MTNFNTPAMEASKARFNRFIASRQAGMDRLNAAKVVEDKCSWSFCDNQAYATWSRKGYCYSCFRDIMDSKD